MKGSRGQKADGRRQTAGGRMQTAGRRMQRAEVDSNFLIYSIRVNLRLIPRTLIVQFLFQKK